MANPTILKGFTWISGATVTPSRLNAETDAATLQFDAPDQLAGRVTAGAGPAEAVTCTAAGRALIDDADAAAQRTTLGLGTAATQASSAFDAAGAAAAAQAAAIAASAQRASNLSDLGSPATARNNLGLGSAATQASSAFDAAGAAATAAAAAQAAAIAASAQRASNLGDLANAATARSNLGLGSNALGDRTVSTSAPSGTPADGAIWLQV